MTVATSCRGVLVAALLFLSSAAFAIKVPLPTPDATLNLIVTSQTQALVTENGAPSGTNPAFDIFSRRIRLLANGDIGDHFSYFVQVDNPNFGKFGVFSSRVIIQDAWVGWSPGSLKSESVVYIEGA